MPAFWTSWGHCILSLHIYIQYQLVSTSRYRTLWSWSSLNKWIFKIHEFAVKKLYLSWNVCILFHIIIVNFNNYWCCCFYLYASFALTSLSSGLLISSFSFVIIIFISILITINLLLHFLLFLLVSLNVRQTFSFSRFCASNIFCAFYHRDCYFCNDIFSFGTADSFNCQSSITWGAFKII